MSLNVSDDLVVITNEDPRTNVFLRYRPESGRVVIGTGEDVGTIADLDLLISALKAVKTTKDNELARRREALKE